jgi:general secretion pathway protein G
MVKPASEARWSGPYLKKNVPADTWGNPYQYKSPGEHGEYDLSSLGKDGQPGGVDEMADIVSW